MFPKNAAIFPVSIPFGASIDVLWRYSACCPFSCLSHKSAGRFVVSFVPPLASATLLPTQLKQLQISGSTLVGRHGSVNWKVQASVEHRSPGAATSSCRSSLFDAFSAATQPRAHSLFAYAHFFSCLHLQPTNEIDCTARNSGSRKLPRQISLPLTKRNLILLDCVIFIDRMHISSHYEADGAHCIQV